MAKKPNQTALETAKAVALETMTPNSEDTMSETMEQDSGTDQDNSGAANIVTLYGVSIDLDDVSMDKITINGTDYTLPYYYKALIGTPISDRQADVLDAALRRQFANNETANAKARAIRYAKAMSEGKAPASTDYAWTQEQYLDKWLGLGEYAKVGPYMPEIGEAGARISQAERNKLEAAKRAWAEIVAEHNDMVARKVHSPLLRDQIVQSVASRPTKTKDVSTEKHEANVKTWAEAQEAIYRKVLVTDKFQSYVTKHLNAIEAEQGKGKEAAQTASAGADQF